MSRIAKRKSALHFEVDTEIQGRTLIVEPGAYTVSLRQKGKQQRYEVAWESIFWLGAKGAAEAAKRERKERGSRANH